MLKITEFKLNHLARAGELEDITAIYSDNPEAIHWYTQGPSYTMYDEEGIGMALAWSIPTLRVEKYPIYFTKMGRWIVKTGFETFSLHKIFCFVETDDPTAIRWAQVLGFKREARLKQHGANRKDVFVYSILKEAD
jgi:hypothetical protein